MNKKVTAVFVSGCVFVIIMMALGGFITTLAWNAVIPQVFGLPPIDFIQGYALNLLGWALFKSHYQLTT